MATEKWERISRILTLINNPFRGQFRVKVSRLSTRRWSRGYVVRLRLGSNEVKMKNTISERFVV